MHITVTGAVLLAMLAYMVSLIAGPIVYAIREARKAKTARLIKEHV
jgi:hypothetical protein